jgi:hypothetical protein
LATTTAGPWMAGGAVIVFLILLGVAGYWHYKQSPPTTSSSGLAATPTPSLASSFEIVSYHSKWTAGWFFAVGEIKNNGTKAADAMIEVIARDANGVLVDGGKTWVAGPNGIPAGDSTAFDYMITADKAAVSVEVKVISAREWK